MKSFFESSVSRTMERSVAVIRVRRSRLKVADCVPVIDPIVRLSVLGMGQILKFMIRYSINLLNFHMNYKHGKCFSPHVPETKTESQKRFSVYECVLIEEMAKLTSADLAELSARPPAYRFFLRFSA